MKQIILILLCFCLSFRLTAGNHSTEYRVVAFFTAKNDLAHISFVHEANRWFAREARIRHFTYDTTSNWNNLDSSYLAKYRVVIFLDTRPETMAQRKAFEMYMKNGGAWMGFHFSAFAMNHTDFPQDWDWYHVHFLGSGEYKGNTWRPTKAVLRVENRHHPVTRHLPKTFTASLNEWYSWQSDLRSNPDIVILASIDPVSFPLGTGPKPNEIWHSGYYPVVWTNKNYRMLYINMGHNDMDYENHTNKELSSTFSGKTQNKLILDGLMWLMKR